MEEENTAGSHYHNHYECDCGEVWDDECDTEDEVNDCEKCGADVEPHESTAMN